MSNQIPVHNVTPPAKKPGDSVDLYASREKIYTRAFTGLFRNLRIAGGAVLRFVEDGRAFDPGAVYRKDP